MNYEAISYFVSKWQISEKRIRVLCAQGRINGAIKRGKIWLIPIATLKPLDKRVKQKNDLFFNPLDFVKIDEKKKIIDAHRPLSLIAQKQFQEKLIVDWTYNTNAIEGNKLTLIETKVILESGITIEGKSLKDHLEVINHKEAIEHIEGLVKNNVELSEFDIKSIHYLVLKGIDTDNAGKYRNANVFISGATHTPPDYIDVPFEMQKLIAKYREWGDLHPVVRAGFLHGEFVKIHPFIDGNGRTARLLLNFELMRSGYPPIVIKTKNRMEYYNALDKAHTTNDYTDFIKIIVDLVNEAEDVYLYLIRV